MQELNLTVPQTIILIVFLLTVLVFILKIEYMNQLANDYQKQCESLIDCSKELEKELRNLTVQSRYGAVARIEHHYEKGKK